MTIANVYDENENLLVSIEKRANEDSIDLAVELHVICKNYRIVNGVEPNYSGIIKQADGKEEFAAILVRTLKESYYKGIIYIVPAKEKCDCRVLYNDGKPVVSMSN